MLDFTSFFYNRSFNARGPGSLDEDPVPSPARLSGKKSVRACAGGLGFVEGFLLSNNFTSRFSQVAGAGIPHSFCTLLLPNEMCRGKYIVGFTSSLYSLTVQELGPGS